MNKILCAVLTSLFLTSAFGQKIEKIHLDRANSISNYYTMVHPPKLPYSGFMFLVGGFGQTAEDILLQTSLPRDAAQNGILTIIPTFKTGTSSFGIDNETQQSFKEILQHVEGKYKLIDLPFFIGGFSIGGSCAIKFAEISNNENYSIKPAAVFAVDPPLDFERFYYSREREIRLSTDATSNEEAVYMIDRIQKEIGNPKDHQKEFHKISPYSLSDNNQTAIKSLISTPIRIYTEPDVNWWIRERGGDFSSMNALDASGMINELNRLGNKKASLIVTQNKGFRQPENIRHPHSWSIIESNELIKWLFSQKNASR
jgi:hypothetical protein